MIIFNRFEPQIVELAELKMFLDLYDCVYSAVMRFC